MAGVRLATMVFGLALLLLPTSSAVKQIINLTGITWVAPTLVLGLVTFVLTGLPISDRLALALALFAVLSGSCGSFFLGASAQREHSALYAFYAEPLRLCLNILWYFVCVKLITIKRDFMLRCLAVSAILQLAIAVYFYLALYFVIEAPDILTPYLAMYRARQVIWIAGTPIYRMAGTFIEGPPFGLFMFSCLAIFVLSWMFKRNSLAAETRPWVLVGIFVSAVGTIASLSDGVLLASVVFAIACYLQVRPKLLTKPARKVIEAVAILCFSLTIGLYTVQRLAFKWELAKAPTPINNDVIGDSGAERMFHIRYGISRFTEVPLALLSGLGPGRYGDYATRTGMFPPTVDIAFMPAEWLIEFGLCGVVIILAWLWRVARHSRASFGATGVWALFALLIANTGQANWLWETWFLALAFLYASPRIDQTANQSSSAGLPMLDTI